MCLVALVFFCFRICIHILGSWTRLFILQAYLESKCKLSNSSNAQQSSQGLLDSALSEKLNIDESQTSPGKATGHSITMGQPEGLRQGRKKPGGGTGHSQHIVQEVIIKFRQCKHAFYPQNKSHLISHLYFILDHSHTFFLQILLLSVPIAIN